MFLWVGGSIQLLLTPISLEIDLILICACICSYLLVLHVVHIIHNVKRDEIYRFFLPSLFKLDQQEISNRYKPVLLRSSIKNRFKIYKKPCVLPKQSLPMVYIVQLIKFMECSVWQTDYNKLYCYFFPVV